MPYAKAHPFGYKKTNRSKQNNANTPLHYRQTVPILCVHRVMRRTAVWEKDPNTGESKMKLVPVFDGVGKNRKPVYDEFHTIQQKVVSHFGRPRKGRTLAEMVYETYPNDKVK